MSFIDEAAKGRQQGLLSRLLSPVAPPYDALEWNDQPYPEKSRMVCRAWALEGYGTPPAVFMVLGWNFGDGHLHQEALLHAVQSQCAFDPGELRCIFAESQPLFGSRLAYRVLDASTGVIESGHLDVAKLRQLQPWPES